MIGQLHLPYAGVSFLVGGNGGGRRAPPAADGGQAAAAVAKKVNRKLLGVRQCTSLIVRRANRYMASASGRGPPQRQRKSGARGRLAVSDLSQHPSLTLLCSLAR